MGKNILIVDDHPFLRMGVRTFLEKSSKDIFCVETDLVSSTPAILENTVFDFAFEKASADNFNIITWLENANKALNIKHKEAKKDEEIYFSPCSACKSAI